MLGAGSGCLSAPQLLFKEKGIRSAQGSRAIQYEWCIAGVQGAPESTVGQNNKLLLPPPWRPERGGKKIPSTNWPSCFRGTLRTRGAGQLSALDPSPGFTH